MNYKQTAQEILTLVGGKENVSNLSHCATRLRLQLITSSTVDHKAVEEVDGVVSVVEKAGIFQIIIGLDVDKVYAEFEKLIGKIESTKSNTVRDEEGDRSDIISTIFSAISGIFAPLLPILAGSGILRGLTLLAVQVGILQQGSGTYEILTIASMTVFHFLPVMLAFSSGKRFGVSPYISAIIGAALINPEFYVLMGSQGNGATTSFLGIPVVLMDYSATVIPIILSIWAYSYVEKTLEKYIPIGMQLVFVPLISLFIMVPFTMIAIGPLGVYGGEMIASIVNYLMESSGLLAGVIVGGGWSVLVSFGLHWAVNPIMINNVSTIGLDYIVPLTFACNFAVIGTALGVFLKTKDTKKKHFNLTGIITIALSGIIEPTLYGTLVKNRMLFLCQIIGGAVGGAFMGFFRVSSNAFVFGGVTTIPAFVGGNLAAAIIGLLISVVVSAILAYICVAREEKNEQV
jgi:Phosphotransferase system IIC components, glucose/maltose/N-acetylglucosamine-specific